MFKHGSYFIISAATIILDLLLEFKAGLFVPPYQSFIEHFRLSPESSDGSIEHAINTMNEHFKERCKAGWVLAVTRNGKRIIVSEGLMEVGKSCR